MGRARLPFTKKFQPKFSVFSCANTHSATKTKSHKRKREKLLFLALMCKAKNFLLICLKTSISLELCTYVLPLNCV